MRNVKTACVFLILVILFNLFCNNKVHALSAKSAVTIESKSGKVLFEKNSRTPLPMASTTKIMTAVCAIENTNLDNVVKVDDKAVGVEGSSMYLEHGEEITVKNLLYGLMLPSGNDAAVAIAIHVSGSIDEFVSLMNETAEKIGVTNTSFKNPNGLPQEGHYTTAYDLAMITRYAMKYDVFREITSSYEKNIPWSTREYDRTLKNHNKLLKMYDGATGVKTGFTKKAGRCLVSSAKRNGIEIIAVTLNAPDDWNDHIKMLDEAFVRCEQKKMYDKGDYVQMMSVEGADTESVALVTSDEYSRVIIDGNVSDLRVEVNAPVCMKAPLGFEQKVGEMLIYEGETLVGTIDVVTSQVVAKKKKIGYIENLKKIFLQFVSNT